MIDTAGLRRLLRDTAPWIVGALCLEIGVHILWPAQLSRAMIDKAQCDRLSVVVPDEPSLRAKTDALAKDSARLAERLAVARSRQIIGTDPAAQLAAQVVPLLADRGWKLDRVKADAANGFATLDVGASSAFANALTGLEAIRTLPFSVKIRKLSLRPGTSGRLSVDIQISVPARGTP